MRSNFFNSADSDIDFHALKPIGVSVSGKGCFHSYLQELYVDQMRAAQAGAIKPPLHRWQEVVLSIDHSIGALQQWVTITQAFIDAVILKGGDSVEEIVPIAFERRPEHLTRIGRDALNEYNARYYESAAAHEGLPTMYTGQPVVAQAFAECLHSALPSGPVRIKEVCAGQNSLSRWRCFFERSEGSREIDLVLADGAYAETSSSIHQPFRCARVRSEYVDLLKPLACLPVNERFDLVVACYGFDSVWLPGDAELCKYQGSYYEHLYRVAVPDWHPNRDALHDAFARGTARHLSYADFDNLVLERATCPVDLSGEPWLEEMLSARVGEGEGELLHLPLGFVGLVDAVFENQLSSDGRIVITDTGSYDEGPPAASGFLDSGTPALARSFDFKLAEQLLRRRGYEVTVSPLKSFVTTWLEPERLARMPSSRDLDSFSAYQFVLEVRKVT